MSLTRFKRESLADKHLAEELEAKAKAEKKVATKPKGRKIKSQSNGDRIRHRNPRANKISWLS